MDRRETRVNPVEDLKDLEPSRNPIRGLAPSHAYVIYAPTVREIDRGVLMTSVNCACELFATDIICPNGSRTNPSWDARISAAYAANAWASAGGGARVT